MTVTSTQRTSWPSRCGAARRTRRPPWPPPATNMRWWARAPLPSMDFTLGRLTLPGAAHGTPLSTARRPITCATITPPRQPGGLSPLVRWTVNMGQGTMSTPPLPSPRQKPAGEFIILVLPPPRQLWRRSRAPKSARASPPPSGSSSPRHTLRVGCARPGGGTDRLHYYHRASQRRRGRRRAQQHGGNHRQPGRASEQRGFYSELVAFRGTGRLYTRASAFPQYGAG